MRPLIFKTLVLSVMIFVFNGVGQAENLDHQREYSIILTESGYFPKGLMVYEGEKVRFYLTSTLGNPGCFVVDKHNLFMSASKGEVTEGVVEFKKAGRFKFYCPSTKYIGYITVHGKHVEEERRPASEEVRPSYWLPRDY